MPELPEVHTTVTALEKMLVGLRVVDIWTDYNSPYYHGKDQIKDPAYFKFFKKEIMGKKIVHVSRRAKNILIHLSGNKISESGKTILIHMKMTGHLLYGKYMKQNPPKRPAGFTSKKSENSFEYEPWAPVGENPLRDSWNKWIHLVFTLSNKKHLVLSDLRKFAKITLVETTLLDAREFVNVGPEPLEKDFTPKVLKERLSLRSNGFIKTVLMDQSIVAGIGNIYSDEALWLAGIHPESKAAALSDAHIKSLHKNILAVLKKGIDFQGSSESDYRAPDGTMGKFQHKQNAYRKTGKVCKRKNCQGIITRKVVNGRSAHFCSVCQKKIV